MSDEDTRTITCDVCRECCLVEECVFDGDNMVCADCQAVSDE